MTTSFIEGRCNYCFRKSEATFCSPSCKQRHDDASERFKTEGNKCKICGVKVINPKLHICSRQCNLINIYRNRALKTTKPKKISIEKNCEICGVEFKTSDLDNTTCGKTCLLEAKNRKKLENFVKRSQINKKYQQPLQVKAVCPLCGREHIKKLDVPFIGSGTPRLRCADWPYCASFGAMDAFEASRFNWELSNGAMI